MRAVLPGFCKLTCHYFRLKAIFGGQCSRISKHNFSSSLQGAGTGIFAYCNPYPADPPKFPPCPKAESLTNNFSGDNRHFSDRVAYKVLSP